MIHRKYKIAPRIIAGTPSLIDEEGSSDEDGRLSSDEESKPIPVSASRDSNRRRENTVNLQVYCLFMRLPTSYSLLFTVSILFILFKHNATMLRRIHQQIWMIYMVQ